MKIDPHSAEFADLIDRWLDGTATTEEAARLWQAVGECPECARELAMASRFESLLEVTVKERAAEKVAPPIPTLGTARNPVPSRPARRPSVWLQPEMRWIAAVAALVVTGFFTALFWPEAQPAKPAVAAHETVAPIPQPPVRRLPDQQNAVAQRNGSPEAMPSQPEVPLVERLDRFFLTGVSLDKIPLGRAIGILQGQLREVNYEEKLALDQLRVLVPTDASQRQVTLHCGPIPFLKAVRAVAALAGCEVVVSEPQITITIQQSIYPQLAEKRVLSDMLAGRLNKNGSAMVDDPTRLAALRQDATTLGVTAQSDGTVAMTRGQWEALKMLTETRDYIGSLPLPAYAVYSVDEKEPKKSDQTLSSAEVQDLRQQVAASGVQPLITFTPQLAGASNVDPIQLEPIGETLALTLNPGSIASKADPNAGPSQLEPLVFGSLDTNFIVGTGQTNNVSLDGGMIHFNADSTFLRTGQGTMTLSGTNSVGSNQVIARGNITVNSKQISAETMRAIVAWAAANGATLVVLPVENTPP
jgi:hypothetical protein